MKHSTELYRTDGEEKLITARAKECHKFLLYSDLSNMLVNPKKNPIRDEGGRVEPKKASE